LERKNTGNFLFKVTAPGVRFSNKEELYLNVCLLGQQRRTRLVPSQFPLIFDDHLVFEKVFSIFHQNVSFASLHFKNGGNIFLDFQILS
jgi:hypothetical protein